MAVSPLLTQPLLPAVLRIVCTVLILGMPLLNLNSRICGLTAAYSVADGTGEWWARQDSNLGPRDYESPALTN